MRLTTNQYTTSPFDASAFDAVFDARLQEANEFYAGYVPTGASPELASIQRQAFAGMLWNKQFYHYDIEQWLHGDDPEHPPPASRLHGRNHQWKSLHNEDVISMPDKWEYPWYAVWDLAFHCVPIAMIDPDFAKKQLILVLREWYMAPNGQIPAYEWAFGDVNPPVHAWATLQVYKLEKKHWGTADTDFLKKVFQKLMINFTWWVNQKDKNGNNVFEGGFLGLDNIGIFDRSQPLPKGLTLEQADGTSWMGMYCLNMMEMALEIAKVDCAFEDVATKFFEHFIYIAESLNHIGLGDTGLWDEEEGFYYDMLNSAGGYMPLKVRSLVGLTSLFAVTVIEQDTLKNVPNFVRRLKWFRDHRQKRDKYLVIEDFNEHTDVLFSLVRRDRLERLLTALVDEGEFLSPGGIRSISKRHEQYYSVHLMDQEFGITYQPGESDNNMFGGNSNWRGPVWMPMNYLLVQSLYEYMKYYQNNLTVPFPTGNGQSFTLKEVADEISKRLVSIFQADAEGNRPVNDGHPLYRDPHFNDLVLFYEYFHGDNSRGLGASHQCGWTGLVAELIHHCFATE